MSLVLNRGDRKMLQDWIEERYPTLKVSWVYRGLYVTYAEQSGPYILIRNDRHIVSYNPKTDRTYSQRGPSGYKWRHRLKESLSVKFKKFWGVEDGK